MKIIFESRKRLNEDKVVKFDGEVYPNFGWCVMLMGGGGSGKGSAYEKLVPIQGRYMNIDDLKENPNFWQVEQRKKKRDAQGNVVKDERGRTVWEKTGRTYRDDFAGMLDSQGIDIEDIEYMGKVDVNTAKDGFIKGRDPYDKKLKGTEFYETGQGRDRLKAHLRNANATGALHTAIKPLAKKYKADAYTYHGADPERLPNIILDMVSDEPGDIGQVVKSLKPAGYKFAIVWIISTASMAMSNNQKRGRAVEAPVLLSAHRKVLHNVEALFASPFLKMIDNFWVINTFTPNWVFKNDMKYHDYQNVFQIPTTPDGIQKFEEILAGNEYWNQSWTQKDKSKTFEPKNPWSLSRRMNQQKNYMDSRYPNLLSDETLSMYDHGFDDYLDI